MDKPVEEKAAVAVAAHGPRARASRARQRRRAALQAAQAQAQGQSVGEPRPVPLGARILRLPLVQRTVASVVANYLRFVNRTSRVTFDPEAPYARYVHLAPVIFTMWHGQHFMLPFARIFDFDVRVLISRHHDGEINARVAEKLGIGTIRGSTARDPTRVLAKGGMTAFVQMTEALAEGACVTMTADISNLAPRRAGRGVVALAKASGRPIVPIAYASSRRIDVKSWDRATINLPFSRAVVAVAEPIFVPQTADDGVLERKRVAVQRALDEATARAYGLVDRRPA